MIELGKRYDWKLINEECKGRYVLLINPRYRASILSQAEELVSGVVKAVGTFEDCMEEGIKLQEETWRVEKADSKVQLKSINVLV